LLGIDGVNHIGCNSFRSDPLSITGVKANSRAIST
jgi:hypothetical protein